MKKSHLLILVLSLIYISKLTAQPGALDVNFNSTPVGIGLGSGANLLISAIAQQADEKIIIGGSFSSFNGVSAGKIARLNPDGTLDLSFATGSGISDNSSVQAIAVQGDGKIILGGGFTSFNGSSLAKIARLNADGTVDGTFNIGTGLSGSFPIVHAVVIQADGKILVGGSFSSFNGTSRNGIVRLNTDGTIDTGFNPGTGVGGEVRTISIQNDGKILLGGYFTSYNGTARENIVRVNSNGSIDSSFNPGTGLTGLIQNNSPGVFSISLQTDGKIIIGGTFTSYNGSARNGIVRVNSNGGIDNSFSGSGADNTIRKVAIQPDGKILLGGSFTTINGIAENRIARLASDGSIDGSFVPGTAANNYITDLLLQNDGKIIAVGNFTSYNGTARGRITHLNNDGSMYIAQLGANNTVYSIVVQSDQKIIVGGSFTTINAMNLNRIARLNQDGQMDYTFNPGTGADEMVSVIVIQPDGKILVGGSFSNFNGVAIKGIVRLNNDGSLDQNFSPGTGVNGSVKAIKIQSDGKILIGGSFSTLNGTNRVNIARLNDDGTIDLSFNPGAGPTGGGGWWGSPYVSSIVETNGKIIIGGYFLTYDGVSRRSLAGINQDGTIDLSFDPGTSVSGGVFNVSNAGNMLVQDDGKIIVGGSFTSYNGYSGNRLIRINSDGSFDNTFNTGTAADSAVYDILLDEDDKIIIAGQFSNFNNHSRNKIARLNADGSLDTLFNPGSGASYSINTIAIHTNDKILIGGGFSTYDNSAKTRLARLHNNSIETISFGPGTYCSGTGVPVSISIAYNARGEYQVGNIFTAQISDASGDFNSPISIGSISSVSSGIINAVIPYSTQSGSNYRIRVVSNNPTVYGTDNKYDLTVNQIPLSPVCLVTVDTLSTHNIVYWEKPVTALIDSFFIYREITTNNYQKVGAVAYEDYNEYHDYSADPNTTTYKYKVSVLDTCGFESAKSAFHNTIHLQNNGNGNLAWTQYGIENSGNPVTFYRVYRDDFGTNNFQPINTSIPGGNTTYTDVNYAAYPNARYVVDVNWDISCTPFRSSVTTTRSNRWQNNITVGIEDEFENMVLIYPNPARESITIEIPESISISGFEITNMLGEIVYKESTSQNKNSKKLIDVSHFSKGVYTIKLETIMGEANRKIIFQ